MSIINCLFLSCHPNCWEMASCIKQNVYSNQLNVHYYFQTVVLDGSRILEIKDRLSQVCILGSVLLVTLSAVGPMINQPDSFKLKLKRNLCIILDPALSER